MKSFTLLSNHFITSLNRCKDQTKQDISYTAFIISSVINHVTKMESLKLFIVLQCFTDVSKFAFLSSSLLRCRSSQCEQGVEVCTLQGQRHDWGQPTIVAVFTLYRAVQVSMNPVGSQGICFLTASKSGTVHPASAQVPHSKPWKDILHNHYLHH